MAGPTEYVPLFTPGTAITYHSTGDVKAGQVVEISGDRSVITAAADSAKVAGVAGFDAPEGEDVTVYSAGVQRPVASGQVAAGDLVGAAAGGRVATAAIIKIGLALTGAADGETVQVRFDA